MLRLTPLTSAFASRRSSSSISIIRPGIPRHIVCLPSYLALQPVSYFSRKSYPPVLPVLERFRRHWPERGGVCRPRIPSPLIVLLSAEVKACSGTCRLRGRPHSLHLPRGSLRKQRRPFWPSFGGS